MLTVLDLTWDLKYVSGKGQDESVIHTFNWGESTKLSPDDDNERVTDLQYTHSFCIKNSRLDS